MTEPASPLPALKPCPFCGGEAVQEDGPDELYGDETLVDSWWVRCDGCELFAKSFATQAECVEAWNRRSRLSDGLRPEVPSSNDTAEAVAWLCRALKTLAERHGVTLPPLPRRTQ